MSASKQRTPGITVLAVLGISSGLLALYDSLHTLKLGGYLLSAQGLQSSHISPTPGAFGVALLLFGTGLMLLGLTNVVFGVGAIRLRDWAWPLGVGLQGFNLVVSFVDITLNGAGPAAWLNMVLAAVLLWCLWRPNIRTKYGNEFLFGRA